MNNEYSLQMQSSSLDHSGEVLPQSSAAFTTLSHCWHCLPPSLTKGRQFVTLVTAQFPNVKVSECFFFNFQVGNVFHRRYKLRDHSKH